MSEPRKFKLYVLRYIDDLIRQEFVNIGVCLVEYRDDPIKFVGARFLRDWGRLQAFFPRADVNFLRDWCAQVGRQLALEQAGNYAGDILDSLDSTISIFVEPKSIQTTADPSRELDTVASMYLGNGQVTPGV